MSDITVGASAAPSPAEHTGHTEATASLQGGGFKRFYVRTLLALLPSLLNAGNKISSRVRAESDFQAPGYSFALTVRGTDLAVACRKTEAGKWRRLPAESETLSSCTYCIEFRHLDYAFAAFAGRMTLQDALVARLFTTRGPNDTGVSLTYLFTIVLHGFFFWSAAYRSRPPRTRR